jgi:hypothetical protein
MHMHFEMASNSFSFFGDYLSEWDRYSPSIADIEPFYEHWRIIVDLATIPYTGEDPTHKWALCMTTAMMIRRVTTL